MGIVVGTPNQVSDKLSETAKLSSFDDAGLSELASSLTQEEQNRETDLRRNLFDVFDRLVQDRFEMGRVLYAYRALYKAERSWTKFCEAIRFNVRTVHRIVSGFEAASQADPRIRRLAAARGIDLTANKHRELLDKLVELTPSGTILADPVADSLKTREKSAGRVVVGTARQFFDWLILTGRRHTPNPVIPSFHSQRKSHRLPRPFEPAELALIWDLLDKRGDLVLKLAVALGEESGARISEVCNLRLSDVDLEGQQIFIRLPTKTGVERFAPFHDKSKRLLEEWLTTRGQREHDHVLVAPRGGAMKVYNLRKRLKAVVCGDGKLSSFSFHRLRARAATRASRGGAEFGTVMNLFGWRNPAVAAQYIAYLPENIRAEYARAMDVKNRNAVPEPKTLALDEFFANRNSEPSEPA